jgi:hypothetical protein
LSGAPYQAVQEESGEQLFSEEQEQEEAEVNEEQEQGSYFLDDLHNNSDDNNGELEGEDSKGGSIVFFTLTKLQSSLSYMRQGI